MRTLTERQALEDKLEEAISGLEHLDRFLSSVTRDAYESRYRGTRDALAWVLGHTDRAPFTGRHVPNPGQPDVYTEWGALEDAMHGSVLRRPVPFDYAYLSSLSYALEWAEGMPREPPDIS